MRLTIKNVFFFSCFFYFLGCGFDYNFNKNQKDVPQNLPDAHIYNFTTSYLVLKKKQWDLKAQHAFFYNKSDTIKLSNLKLVNYNQKGESVSKINARTGIVNNKTKNIKLISNVVIISSNETKVTGNYFFWDNEKELITSHKPVTVYRSNGDIQHSTGMKADKQLDRIEFTMPEGEVKSETF